LKYSGQSLILGGLFLALALILPIFFHAFGLGSAALPMFYPIIVCAFLVEFPVSLTVGLLAPLTSSFLTGMPPLFPPIALVMMVEAFVLTSIPALLYQKHKMKVVPALVITILAERMVLLVMVVLLARWLSLPEGVLGFASVIHGMPGIVIILLVIPPLVKSLEKKIRVRHILE